MTYVNPTVSKVEVVVSEANGNVTTVVAPSTPGLVTAITEGPQGPQGPAGGSVPLASLSDVDASAVTDKSVLYYDASSLKFIADAVWTIPEVTNGGNF